MPHPILIRIQQKARAYFGPHFLLLLKQQLVGLCEDYWADGSENLLGLDYGHFSFTQFKADLLKIIQPKQQPPATVPPMAGQKKQAAPSAKTTQQKTEWHAAPGEISEKMWGAGLVTPADDTLTGKLITPLGLTNAMSVLDLSAGLGGRMRKTAQETGAYFTGLEPDPSIAERGMQLSVKAGKSKHAFITHYDPSNLVLNRSYDCVIARETLYRVPDRAAFVAVIAKNTKPHAQIAFTDYILDPEHREKPAILAWKKNEKLANPAGFVEMAELWAKGGFGLRVHEDLSDFYKKEVMAGMKRLMEFLASGVVPDKETGVAILRRIDTWKYRMAAMDSGLKFYRFYGTKH